MLNSLNQVPRSSLERLSQVLWRLVFAAKFSAGHPGKKSAALNSGGEFRASWRTEVPSKVAPTTGPFARRQGVRPCGGDLNFPEGR